MKQVVGTNRSVLICTGRTIKMCSHIMGGVEGSWLAQIVVHQIGSHGGPISLYKFVLHRPVLTRIYLSVPITCFFIKASIVWNNTYDQHHPSHEFINLICEKIKTIASRTWNQRPDSVHQKPYQLGHRSHDRQSRIKSIMVTLAPSFVVSKYYNFKSCSLLIFSFHKETW